MNLSPIFRPRKTRISSEPESVSNLESFRFPLPLSKQIPEVEVLGQSNLELNAISRNLKRVRVRRVGSSSHKILVNALQQKPAFFWSNLQLATFAHLRFYEFRFLDWVIRFLNCLFLIERVSSFGSPCLPADQRTIESAPLGQCESPAYSSRRESRHKSLRVGRR